MEPPIILNIPLLATLTPPPPEVELEDEVEALLPEMIPLFMVKIPLFTNTPPPKEEEELQLMEAVLLAIVPLFIIKIPPNILTPPPRAELQDEKVLPETVPPFMMNIPFSPTCTPPAIEELEVLEVVEKILPVMIDPSFIIKVPTLFILISELLLELCPCKVIFSRIRVTPIPMVNIAPFEERLTVRF
jgi:hypothetical protein